MNILSAAVSWVSGRSQKTINALLSRITLTREELETLERFSHMPRKLEWLSVRVLLNEMTDKELSILL